MFVNIAGQLVQKVLPPPHVALPVTDLSHLPTTQRATEAQRLATQQAKQAFNLRQDLLLRALLVQHQANHYQLFLTLHHLIIDGVSLILLLQELASLYRAHVNQQPSPLPALSSQYPDFTLWQQQQHTADKLASQLSYWKHVFGQQLPILQLPTDYPYHPDTSTQPSAKQYFVVPASLTAKLKALSTQAGCTLFMTLLAAFNLLLYRYCGQDDIVVGTVVAVRHHPEQEKLLGYFLNTLVLRTDLSANPTFRQLLARVREVTVGAMAHRDLPHVTLLEALRIERHLGQNALV